jgi:hypothetical protein
LPSVALVESFTDGPACAGGPSGVGATTGASGLLLPAGGLSMPPHAATTSRLAAVSAESTVRTIGRSIRGVVALSIIFSVEIETRVAVSRQRSGPIRAVASARVDLRPRSR